MAKKYFTRTTKTKGICPLYIQIARRTPKVRMTICTGIDVDIATWNKVNRTDNTWRNFTMTEEGKELNDKLVLVEKAINQLFEEGRIRSNEDKDVIVEAIRPIVNADLIDHQAEQERKRREEAELRKRSILGFYEYFMEGIQDGTIRYGDNRVYSKASVYEWKFFGNKLRGYLKDESMTFDEITKPFADKFFAYLDKSGPRELKVKVAQALGTPVPEYALKPPVLESVRDVPAWSVDLGWVDMMDYEHNRPGGIADKVSKGKPLTDFELTLRLAYQDNKAYSEALRKQSAGEALTPEERQTIAVNQRPAALLQSSRRKRKPTTLLS